MTRDAPIDPQVVHEAWQRACRVDELLSRFGSPPASLPLVEAILQRARTGAQPPDAVLAGHAAGLSAPQWAASGEVVQRQIGQLMLTVSDFVETEPKTLTQIHMVVSAAAARVSLEAWRAQAETDGLTRLRNGYGLQADLEFATAREGALRIGFIDLDGLKAVNTRDGHDAGDRLIRDFGDRLRQEVHDAGGTAYRPHGDEFIVTMLVADGDLDAVLSQLAQTNDFAFSWGVAEWPADDEDVQTVQRIADQAMYAMKEIHKAGSKQADAVEEAEAPK